LPLRRRRSTSTEKMSDSTPYLSLCQSKETQQRNEPQQSPLDTCLFRLLAISSARAHRTISCQANSTWRCQFSRDIRATDCLPTRTHTGSSTGTTSAVCGCRKNKDQSPAHTDTHTHTHTHTHTRRMHTLSTHTHSAHAHTHPNTHTHTHTHRANKHTKQRNRNRLRAPTVPL
jgi:hypothetical protein